MTFISYAQNGEDVVLGRAFDSGHAGFYIDIGASDPVVDSVTKHFYDSGWRGINVEPASVALRALVGARPRDLNLGVAVAAEPGELTFYELPEAMNGCSTSSEALAEEYAREGWEVTPRTVPVVTLAQLCGEHATAVIDFLKIDVEGDEGSVLAGADFARFRPRVLVIEATRPGTPAPAHEAWEPAVLGAGFRLALFDGLNRFYVDEDDDELAARLGVPANVFDDWVSHRLLEAERRAEDHARRLDGVQGALAATRAELARSQAELRDARTELAAARAALARSVPNSR